MYRAAGRDHLRSVGEVEYVNGFAAMAASDEFGGDRIMAGIVGARDLCQDPALVRESLERQLAVSDSRLRGIRVTASFDPYGFFLWSNTVPHLLSDPQFLSGLEVLEDSGWSPT